MRTCYELLDGDATVFYRYDFDFLNHFKKRFRFEIVCRAVILILKRFLPTILILILNRLENDFTQHWRHVGDS